MKRVIFCILALALVLAGCTQPEPTVPTETTEPPYTLPPSLYTPEDFVQVGDYLTCTAGDVIVGIDVSSHQGKIDWQTVADAGIRYAFVRLGYRGYGNGALQTDVYARLNLEGAKAAGIAVGAYFFSQAIDVAEAKQEAAYALGILGGFELDLPLVYDWEYVNDTARTANMDKRTLTDCTLAFCEAVEQAGYDPMVYFNSSQITRLLFAEEIEQYPWWLAKYDPALDFPCRADMWQYTNQGTVPGIPAPVDIDLMFAEYGLGQACFGEQ